MHTNQTKDMQTYFEVVIEAIIQILNVHVQKADLDIVLSWHSYGPAVMGVIGVHSGIQRWRYLTELPNQVVAKHWEIMRRSNVKSPIVLCLCQFMVKLKSLIRWINSYMKNQPKFLMLAFLTVLERRTWISPDTHSVRRWLWILLHSATHPKQTWSTGCDQSQRCSWRGARFHRNDRPADRWSFPLWFLRSHSDN